MNHTSDLRPSAGSFETGKSAARVINIQPVTRIEGHARIAIHLDEEAMWPMPGCTYGHEGSKSSSKGDRPKRSAHCQPHLRICPWQHH